jgi:hypothetical protein
MSCVVERPEILTKMWCRLKRLAVAVAGIVTGKDCDVFYKKIKAKKRVGLKTPTSTLTPAAAIPSVTSDASPTQQQQQERQEHQQPYYYPVWLTTIVDHEMFGAFTLALVVFVCLFVVHRILSRHKVRVGSVIAWLIVYILLSSIAMNYIKEYSIIKAKKYVVVQKGLPQGCMHHGGSVKDFLKAMGKVFFIVGKSEDACLEFTKAVMIDPLWELPPTNAVAVTLTNLFMSPIKVIAEHTNEMFIILFDEVPILLIPVLCFSVLYIATILVMVKCKYRVSIPWFVVIEPMTLHQPSTLAIGDRLAKEIRVNEMLLQQLLVAKSNRIPRKRHISL